MRTTLLLACAAVVSSELNEYPPLTQREKWSAIRNDGLKPSDVSRPARRRRRRRCRRC